MPGLTEVRKQLLDSFPSKQDVTENEWTADVISWAEQAKGKLEMTLPPTRRRDRKPPPPKVKSLTQAELATVRAMILRCTDIYQLSDMRKTLNVHMAPIVQYVRVAARRPRRTR